MHEIPSPLWSSWVICKDHDISIIIDKKNRHFVGMVDSSQADALKKCFLTKGEITLDS